MKEFVKVRTVAGSVVVSLPQSVLAPVGIKAGDRVVVEAAPPRRLIITKEGETMTSTQRLELEIDLLEKKKKALASDLRYKERQYNSCMPCEEGMADNEIAILIMSSLVRDQDQVDVEIAEKRLELYEIQGS
jgi:antitoxin component of MazEF toxin-antitoxin module